MSSIETVFRKYRGKRVLMDSNLLLLYLIGTFQREQVTRFKRTSQFTTFDFDSLVSLLSQFKQFVTTPHILTEVSNLANALPASMKSDWSEHFASNIRAMDEVHDSAVSITEEPSFNPFGITDAALQKAAVDTLLLTEDFRLAGYLRSFGVDALNFRELPFA